VHRRILRDAVISNAGVEVDTQGDAFFFTFSDAQAALKAAVAAQAALAGGPIRVRMGLHTGEPVRTDEGWVGLDVHLGARVAAAGHGGQILLTNRTRDLIDGTGLRDLGEHRVKDFDQPVWLYQAGSESYPPLRTIGNTNLPRPTSSFVGREREVAALIEVLGRSRFVTLTGPGGSGKTRLAIEAASELVGDFKNGVFWVPLSEVSDAALVLPAIARAIEAQGELRDEIGRREMLLVLDNLEHVVEVSPALAALVESCPSLSLLVTSRELLRVRGEQEVEVLPLAEKDAVALFCSRAQLEPNAAVAELCRRLDNMPLALELAAARAKALTPEQILERLEQRLDLFVGGRDAEWRQKTLRATIEWSHDLLSSDEQRLFAGLSVFAGGWQLEAAEAVLGADLDAVQSLAEKSLIRRTGNRFSMLETIREYAQERFAELADADEISRRHADHYLALGESAELTAEAQGAQRPDVVRAEIDNVRRAIDWAAQNDPELAYRLAISLEQFWVMTDAFEGTRRLGNLLEAHPMVAPVLRARALRSYSESRWISGDMDGALPFLDQSLEIFQQLNDTAAIAVIYHRMAAGALTSGDLARGRELLEKSLAICATTPQPRLEADIVDKLGWHEFRLGNYEGAIELFEKSAVLCAETGFSWMQSDALMGIAQALVELGRTAEALAPARAALRINHENVDRRTVVLALANLALFASNLGDTPRAGRLWGAIEAEESIAPLGSWERRRSAYEEAILPKANEEFERGRRAGRALRLDEAVEYALTDS
jgi:predicted ATPase